MTVLGAAVLGMVVGAVWYSPPVFGKHWMKLAGKTEADLAKAKKRGMGKCYLASFVGLLVMNYVFANLIQYVGAATPAAGAQLGFWIWLGFFAPSMLGMVLWDGKPVKLYLLNTLHYLVALLIMGAVLAMY